MCLTMNDEFRRHTRKCEYQVFFSGYETSIKIISFQAPIAVEGPSLNKLNQTIGPALPTQAATKPNTKLHTHFLARIPNPSLHTKF